MDLLNELRALVASLENAGIPYALCGGLAVAVHGRPRATVDIDILVPEVSADAIRALAHGLGFAHEALPMSFSQDRIRIRRLVKLDIEAGEPLLLDLVVVTPALEEVWGQRMTVEWEFGSLHVVSPEGLIRMKQLRDSLQDRADIAALRQLGEPPRAPAEKGDG